MTTETIEFTVCEYTADQDPEDCSTHEHRSESSEVVATIDLTPDAEGYAAIGATFLASVLSDVKQARKNDAHFLITGLVDIAFALGAASVRPENPLSEVQRELATARHDEAERFKEALFARVGGSRRG